MSFSIRLSEQEKTFFTSYAKLHGFSLADAFKNALSEKIEDEYDLKVAQEAYAEFLADPETFTHDEVWKGIV